MRLENDDKFEQKTVTLVGHASLDIGETFIVTSKVIFNLHCSILQCFAEGVI